MGRKKGAGARTPYEAPNTLNSAQNLRIIDAICEGEIAGFANGDNEPFKSIYFDDTPVQNPDGSFNFKGITGFFQAGTPDQSYTPSFEATERTVSVGANVKRNTPIIRAISDNLINRLRVTVGVERNVQIQENGDSVAANTQLVVELVNNSGVQATKNVSFTEKSSGAFYCDVLFDILPAVPFNIRVRRVSPDSQNDKISNNTFFASYVEIIDIKMSYPYTALAALKIDSDQFGSQIPRRNYLIKGKIVQVPSNYDPETRQYSGGIWDGSFKMAWTNNPAWVFYDLLTNPRYSTIAKRLTESDIDKWALYQVAKYCDELVPDGFGGQEPRFVCNAYITDQRQAADLLNDLASAFCALSVWNGNQISVLQDKHTDPVAVYNNANVVNGRFDYAGAQMKAIHTAVHVKYADKHDGYRSKVEYVSDNQSISRYGLNVKQVTAFGCDSRGQAARFGAWILQTELKQQHMVTFTVGREGLKHLPYDVIRIADNFYAGAEISGRIAAVSRNQITLDRDVQNAVGVVFFYTDTISGSLKSSKITRQINGKMLETETAINVRVDDVWAMSGQVKPRLYRAMSVKENTNDGTYTITALLHDVEKYGVIDESAVFDSAVSTLHNSTPELDNAAVSTENGGLRVTWGNLTADGEALDYDIKLFRNNVLYRHLPNHDTPEIAFGNLPNGDYRVEIRGRNARGVYSAPLIKSFQINYTINGLRANPKTLAVELVWTLPEIITSKAQTEIWYATTNNIQAAQKLATLPTPQNSYTLTGVAVIDRFWFWVRLVDENGNAGDFTLSVLGQADPNPTPIVQQIQGAITQSALSQTLINQLRNDDLAAENRAKADAAAQITSEANARAAALRAEASARTTAIQAATQQAQANLTTKAQELTAQAALLGNKIQAVESVNAQQAQAIQNITAAQGNVAAALEAEKVARANADRAETAARETLAAKLSNLSVGGRNYLWHTLDFSKNWLKYQKNNQVATTSFENGVYECDHKIDKDWSEIAQDRVITFDKIPVGSRLILSFEAKTNVAGGIRFGFREYYTSGKTWTYIVEKSVNLTVSDDWVRYTVELPPMKTNADADNPLNYIRFLMTNWLVRRFAVRKLKLEIGTVATDWSPAPEDVGNDIQAAIETERAARTTALQAEAAERTALAAKLATAEGNITAERTARTTADQAQTQQIQAAQSRLNAAESNIGNLQRTTSDQNRALSEMQTTLTAKIDGLSVGGRNLILQSQREIRLSDARNTNRHFIDFNHSPQIEFALVRHLTLSVSITAQSATRAGSNFWRVGCETRCWFTDGTNQWLFAWQVAPAAGELTFSGRYSVTLTVPVGKTLQRLSNIRMGIQSIVSETEMLVANPKLEIGNIVTDWTPAPEDSQSFADAVQAELTAYKSAQAAADAAQTAEIQAAKSQIGQAQATLEQMRSTKADKNEVLGLVQTTLQSSWRSDVQAAENRVKADATRLNAATDAKITALQQTQTAQNQATTTQLQTLSASLNSLNFDNLKVGGRNLLLNSAAGRTTLGTSRYTISPNVDLSLINELVLSVDVDVENIRRIDPATYARIGAEIQVFYSESESRWFAAWLPVNETPQTTKQRLVAKLKIPDGKRIHKLTYNKVQIHNATFDRAEVKNVKLETGTLATDWTPAPEDMPPAVNAAINSLQQTTATQNSAIATRMDTITAKVDNFSVGGRNILLSSDKGLRSRNVGNQMWQVGTSYVKFDVSQSVTWHTVRAFTLSCYTEFSNIRGNAGSEFTRLGFECLVHFTDGSSQWISNFIHAPATGELRQVFAGRPAFTFHVPQGKMVARLEHTQLCLQGLTSQHDMVVWRPKIEIGTVATDWTPAAEDMEQKVQSLYTLKVEALGSRKAVAGLAMGADGATGDSQVLIYSDKFALVRPHSDEIKAPFVVTTVHGQAKMALSGDMIVDGVIHGRHIAAGQTLQAPNINGGSLNIGNGRFVVHGDGAVNINTQHGNVGCQFNHKGIVVFDERSVEVVRLGDLW